MTIKVADILNFDFMQEAKLLAGQAGVSREIKYVDIIEVPDVKGWLKEGGLFLTTGYSMKDNPTAQKKIVKSLQEANSAGLCMKKGRYFDSIPEVILACGEKYNFPVIELPATISYVDILLPLIDEILGKEAYLLKRSEKIHQELTKVVLMGGGIDHIAQTLYQLIPRPVLIQNAEQEILALVGEVREKNQLKDSLALPLRKLKARLNNNKVVRIEGENGRSRLIAPIIVAGNIYGYISVFESPDRKIEAIDYRAVEHAATVIALEMLKEKGQSETEKRMQTELLNDLLQNNYSSAKTIAKRASYLGWDLTKDYLTIVIDIDDLESYYLNLEYQDESHIQAVKEEIKKIVRWEMVMENKDPILINQSDSLIIFYNCQNLKTKQQQQQKSLTFARHIRRLIVKNIPDIMISIGIGNFYPEIKGLRQSYKEASQAIKIGKKIYRENGVYHYDELGIFKILVELDNYDVLKEFRQEILGPVLDESGAELLETVDVLLNNLGNKTQAAAELNIHRNSLNYRIKKFSELLGRDLNNSDNLLDIYLAIKISQII